MSLADIYILRPKKTFVQFKQEFNHLRDPVILSKGSEGGKKKTTFNHPYSPRPGNL